MPLECKNKKHYKQCINLAYKKVLEPNNYNYYVLYYQHSLLEEIVIHKNVLHWYILEKVDNDYVVNYQLYIKLKRKNKLVYLCYHKNDAKKEVYLIRYQLSGLMEYGNCLTESGELLQYDPNDKNNLEVGCIKIVLLEELEQFLYQSESPLVEIVQPKNDNNSSINLFLNPIIVNYINKF